MDTDTVLKIADHNAKLTVKQLAEALYEGTPHLQNLAEKLARQHGKAQALSFFQMMGDDVQNFWMGIAQQLIDHAEQWEKNQGPSCVLSGYESTRLAALPRHKDIPKKKRTAIIILTPENPDKHADVQTGDLTPLQMANYLSMLLTHFCKEVMKDAQSIVGDDYEELRKFIDWQQETGFGD